MQLNIKIDMDNSAFEDNEDELKEIFERIEDAVFLGVGGASVRDSNGNKVGFWTVEEV
jgi:hypothetical protein